MHMKLKFREKLTLLKIKISICYLVILTHFFLKLVTKKPGFHQQQCQIQGRAPLF